MTWHFAASVLFTGQSCHFCTTPGRPRERSMLVVGVPRPCKSWYSVQCDWLTSLNTVSIWLAWKSEHATKEKQMDLEKPANFQSESSRVYDDNCFLFCFTSHSEGASSCGRLPKHNFLKIAVYWEYGYRLNDRTDCGFTKTIKWEWDMSLRSEARGIIWMQTRE